MRRDVDEELIIIVITIVIFLVLDWAVAILLRHDEGRVIDEAARAQERALRRFALGRRRGGASAAAGAVIAVVAQRWVREAWP